jgi:predicted RNA-binding Zn-ribbon protein involved in translation (DUF1610 family)
MNVMNERLRFDRLSAMERLKGLLEAQDPQQLRYACLEARLCIEAVVYDKLELYMKRISPDVLERWQPRAAMQALLALEPRADQDVTLRIVREDEDGNVKGNPTVIEHRAMDVEAINRFYNRFGSYLHVPTVVRQKDHAWIHRWQNRLEETLREFVKEIEPILKAPIVTTISRTAEFECEACDQVTVANLIALRETKTVKCIHCGAEYSATALDDPNGARISEEWEFRLKATVFACRTCEEGTAIENRNLRLGMRFACDSCGALHLIADRRWGYGLIHDEDDG